MPTCRAQVISLTSGRKEHMLVFSLVCETSVFHPKLSLPEPCYAAIAVDK